MVAPGLWRQCLNLMSRRLGAALARWLYRRLRQADDKSSRIVIRPSNRNRPGAMAPRRLGGAIDDTAGEFGRARHRGLLCARRDPGEINFLHIVMCVGAKMEILMMMERMSIRSSRFGHRGTPADSRHEGLLGE